MPGPTMPAPVPKSVCRSRCTWSCPPLTEGFEQIVHQVFGLVLGIHRLEQVVGTLVGEVGRGQTRDPCRRSHR